MDFPYLPDANGSLSRTVAFDGFNGVGVALPHSQGFLEELASAYMKGSWRWTGCDWQTRFGPLHLDLCGLRADQARLWSQACQGPESKAWAEAARYLDEVESDALAAEQAAGQAFRSAQQGDFAAALVMAEKAVALEAHYRPATTWSHLLATLRGTQARR